MSIRAVGQQFLENLMQREWMLVVSLVMLAACSPQKGVPSDAKTALCAGPAVYTAISGAAGVTLSASLELPTPGYGVDFVQRPERITPPMYDLNCVAPAGMVAQVITPYTANAVVPGASFGDQLKVHDASGVHIVEVTEPRSPDAAPIGGLCGGIAGVACPTGQYCAMPAGQCEVADNQGRCELKPEVCTQDYQPVCGCDGQTYSNACGAAAAGVNISASGECPTRR
jgi:hypothetical protein